MKNEIQPAPVKDLRPDPQQPRKDFPAAAQAELRESIKVNGIQDAIVVRTDPEKKAKWLIVDGERRWRVAKDLGLATVPILIRDFKDEKDVRAYQRIVGTQRLNLSALEASESFNAALEAARKTNAKLSVTEFAAAQGVARAVAYESLALLKISPPVRAALQAGTLDASKARLFATVPPGEQAKLLKFSTNEQYGKPPPGVRELVRHIAENYARQLASAPWKLTDAELVKSAGTCAACPKRSGNIENMEGNPNVCTDVACYGTKQTAHTACVLKTAEATGARIVPPETYRNFQYSKFEDGDTEIWNAKGRPTLAAVARKNQVAPALTVDAKGRLKEVFTREDAQKLKTLAGVKPDTYAQRENAATKARQKKEKQFAAAAAAAVPLLLKKLVLPGPTGPGLPQGSAKLLCWAAYHGTQIDRHAFVAKRRGLARIVNEAREALQSWIAKTHDDVALAEMAMELLVCAGWEAGDYHSIGWSKAYQAAAKLAGVNLDKLLKAQTPPETKTTKTTPTKKGKKQ